MSVRSLVISAAVRATSYIEQHLGPEGSRRAAMPNTCSAVGCGMTGFAGGHTRQGDLRWPAPCSTPWAARWCRGEAWMRYRTLGERSGCSFAYIILECCRGGVKVGLPDVHAAGARR